MVEFVPETGFQVLPPSVDDSHWIILPVCPLSVKEPLFEVAQTVAMPESTPPFGEASTVMVVADEVAEEQAPLFTTAR